MSTIQKRLKIYTAGFEVFSPTAKLMFATMREVTKKTNVELLQPYNEALKDGNEIFEANVKMIRECDGVVANVNAFRGLEPDSGTAWEIGLAYALGKPIVMYLDDMDAVWTKVRKHYNPNGNIEIIDSSKIFPDGYYAEDLGYPVNLMLAKSGQVIQGCCTDAIDFLIYTLRVEKTTGDKGLSGVDKYLNKVDKSADIEEDFLKKAIYGYIEQVPGQTIEQISDKLRLTVMEILNKSMEKDGTVSVRYAKFDWLTSYINQHPELVIYDDRVYPYHHSI